ncbi:MAG TPA: hypothetical protein VLQ78_12070 [Ornithinibacter sp.]|nr:hypothetical protein [Ornithinibacter sp.]
MVAPATAESALSGSAGILHAADPGSEVSLEPAGSSVRGVLSVLLGSCAVVAGLLVGMTALYDNLRSTSGVALVVVALVLAIGAWLVRASPSHVSVEGGVVDIRKDGSHHRFDLGSDRVQVSMVGQPGERGWRVDFHRRSLPPYSITAQMVDPVQFVAVVRRYRPEL